MMEKSIRLSTFSALLILAACASPLKTDVFSGQSKTLGDYVRAKGYQPLKIPRGKWGPGTVVSFDAKGDENIVMFNDQCVNFVEPEFDSHTDTKDVRVAPSSLNNASFSRDRTIGADVALEKTISPEVDVSGAFKDQRVRDVKVTIGSAKQFVVSDLTLTEKMKSLLGSNASCAQMLLRKGHYVVDDVLVVGSSSFSFGGSGNTTVNLDLGLLKAINLKPELATKYEGKSELPVTEPRIIGYKLYALDASLGAAESTIVAKRVTSAELAVLKRGQP